MATSWCKVASNLDSHPKVRKAGRLGREVFLFALRRNAEPGNQTPGSIGHDELDPDYLADLLMMTCDEAVTGVTAAVTAGLLTRTDTQFVIVGWEGGWGKGGGTGADRTAKWREAKRAANSVTSRVTRGDSGDGCDTDQKRRDQIILSGEGRQRGKRKSPEIPIPPDWIPTREHTELARERGLDCALEALRFRAHADANDRRVVRWNAAFTQWLLKSKPDAGAAQNSTLIRPMRLL